MTEITERIAARMSELKLEPIDLAAGARTSQTTVERWINHYSDPRAYKIVAIARTLDVSVAWLLTGEEQPFDDETVLTIYGIIEPSERMAKRILAKKRLTREEAQEFADWRAGASAARQMLGLEASSDLEAEVARRLVALRAERAATQAADALGVAAEAEQTAQDAEALAARVREEDSLEREEDARPPGRSA